MLKWPRSLALRAVLALLAVHFLTLALGLGVAVLEGRKTRLAAADLALEFVVDDLTYADGRWVLPPGGAFGSLASRNPALWVVAGDQDGLMVFGPAPDPARRLFGSAGAASPPEASNGGDLGALLSQAVVEQQTIKGRPVLLAAGGVDPATITPMDVWRSFSLMSAVTVFIGLGLLGALALLVAIPLLVRAIRPIVDEAASIRPEDVGRRLNEDRAPLELLPLARAFNGALGRLEIELGRRKRLISNVAHELRTPLAVLSLRVDSLSAPGAQRDELRAEVGRLARLVEQMLDLERSSLPSGAPAAFDLTELAQEVISALAPMAVNAGYDLSLDAAPGPVVVSGERQAVARALTNLIGNAIVHGPGRGMIGVSVSEGRVEVSDEGPGVPTDLQPRLFEAFARGPGPAEGSGLGLHLTREIMRGLGGDVLWIRDAPETTFRLTFPPPT